jgi:hypothetical protein
VDVPEQVDAIILECLAKNPDERYQHAREILADLQAVPGYGSGRTRPKMRKTKLGVAVPVLDEDEVSTHSNSFDSHFSERLATADTEVLTIEDLEHDWRHAVLELAEALLDAGANHHALTLGVARVHGLVSDKVRCESEQAELRRRETGVEQRSREREGSLRFAMGELAFDREQCPEGQRADIDMQLDALDARLQSVLSDSETELARITERGIELAATRAEIEEESEAAFGELGAAVDGIVPQWQDDMSVAPLIDRYESITSSLSSHKESADTIVVK